MTAVSLNTHMVEGEGNEMDVDVFYMRSEIIHNDEDEEKCIEAPVDDVEDDVPMADDWV